MADKMLTHLHIRVKPLMSVTNFLTNDRPSMMLESRDMHYYNFQFEQIKFIEKTSLKQIYNSDG